MSEHEASAEDDGYTGAATLLLEGAEVGVQVELRGHFQPIDGYYHWYGRVKASERVSELAAGTKREVEIRTPEGSARGELSDPDPWDRYRITGTSTPPFGRECLAGFSVPCGRPAPELAKHSRPR